MSKYISIEQITASVTRLEPVHPFFGMAFLAFKKAGLPVGHATEFVFSRMVTDFLTGYYRPSASYAGFYNPFRTSKGPDQRWLRPRYASTGHQRITTGTFIAALIHPSDREWGWQPHYVNELGKHIAGTLIPAFDMGVWLYRAEEWPEDVRPSDIVTRFLSDFSITDEERRALFDIAAKPVISWAADSPVTEAVLLDELGRPPGAQPEGGAALRLLELR